MDQTLYDDNGNPLPDQAKAAREALEFTGAVLGMGKFPSEQLYDDNGNPIPVQPTEPPAQPQSRGQIDLSPVMGTGDPNEVARGQQKGLGRTIIGLGDLVTAPGRAIAEKLGIKATQQGYDQVTAPMRAAVEPTNPDQQRGMTAEQMMEFALPSGMAQLMKIPGIAKAPWLVRMLLGSGLEMGQNAAQIKAQGGEITPLGLIASGIGGMAQGVSPAKLRYGAAKSVARAVGATGDEVPAVMEQAPQALEHAGLGVPIPRGKTRLLAHLNAEDAKALIEQKAAVAGLGDVPVKPLATKMEGIGLGHGPTEPLPPTLNVAQIGEIGAAAAKGSKFLSAALQKFNTTWEEVQRSIYAHKNMVGTGSNPFRETMAEQADKMTELGMGFPGKAPGTVQGPELVAYKQMAKPTGKYIKDEMVNEGAVKNAMNKAREAMAEAAHDPNVAGGARLGSADAQFHAVKTLRDIMDKTFHNTIPQDRKIQFTTYLAGRVLMGALVGGGAYKAGNSLPASIAAGGAASLLMNSTTWHSMNAGTKYQIAKAIESGAFEKAVRLFEASAQGASSGLPPVMEH